MAPNFAKMLLSWVGLFALFAALAMANPVQRGDLALFESSSLNHLRVDKGLIPTGTFPLRLLVCFRFCFLFPQPPTCPAPALV